MKLYNEKLTMSARVLFCAAALTAALGTLTPALAESPAENPELVEGVPYYENVNKAEDGLVENAVVEAAPGWTTNSGNGSHNKTFKVTDAEVTDITRCDTDCAIVDILKDNGNVETYAVEATVTVETETVITLGNGNLNTKKGSATTTEEVYLGNIAGAGGKKK